MPKLQPTAGKFGWGPKKLRRFVRFGEIKHLQLGCKWLFSLHHWSLTLLRYFLVFVFSQNWIFGVRSDTFAPWAWILLALLMIPRFWMTHRSLDDRYLLTEVTSLLLHFENHLRFNDSTPVLTRNEFSTWWRNLSLFWGLHSSILRL